jgi:hypothetical protein
VTPLRTGPQQAYAMKFQKGQSGNPGGRPKVVGEVQELARSHTADAVRRLAEIMHDTEAAPAARVAAANALLDRGCAHRGDRRRRRVPLPDRPCHQGDVWQLRRTAPPSTMPLQYWSHWPHVPGRLSGRDRQYEKADQRIDGDLHVGGPGEFFRMVADAVAAACEHHGDRTQVGHRRGVVGGA